MILQTLTWIMELNLLTIYLNKNRCELDEMHTKQKSMNFTYLLYDVGFMLLFAEIIKEYFLKMINKHFMLFLFKKSARIW